MRCTIHQPTNSAAASRAITSSALVTGRADLVGLCPQLDEAVQKPLRIVQLVEREVAARFGRFG